MSEAPFVAGAGCPTNAGRACSLGQDWRPSEQSPASQPASQPAGEPSRGSRLGPLLKPPAGRKQTMATYRRRCRRRFRSSLQPSPCV